MKKNKATGSKGLVRFCEFLVNNKWVFIAIFAVLTIFCCVMIPQTKVEYDLSQYMPKGSDTDNALDLLKKEFDDKGMLYVNIKGVTVEEASALASEMAKLDGIDMVAFIPDMNYIAETQSALYTVTLKDYDSTDASFKTVKTLMQSLEKEDAYFTGQSAYSYYTRLETEASILKIGIVIVIAILVMLFFTSKTYFEIVVMIIVFGVSVALNMGTNFLFNGISYVSNLVALVLQLALSIDYSVIILHRYMEENAICSDVKTATVRTISKGFVEIMSSSLTTIAGLVSLLLMTLPIGVEIGASLAKGIVASLITVVFLMPSLLMLFAKPLQKSRHKSFVPNITKPARAIVRARKIIVPVFLVIVALSCVGQFNNAYAFNMNGAAIIVESQEAIYDDFGTLNSLVVIVPNGDYEKEKELCNYVCSHELMSDEATALASIEVVEGVVLCDSFTREQFIATFEEMAKGTDFAQLVKVFAGLSFDSYVNKNIENATDDTKVPLIDLLEYIYNDSRSSALLPSEYKDMLGQLVYARGNLESQNYSRLTFTIDAPIESEKTFALISELKTGISEYYPEYYIMGESVVCYEMANSFPKDNTIVSVCIIMFVLLILLLAFRNISLPLILILAIQGGVWINFVIPFLAGNAVSFIGYLIINAVQMGATIDYAIVLTNRYRNLRKTNPNPLDAMAEAQNAVFPTIITSGVILIVTGFTLGLAASGVVAQMGSLLGVGALTSVAVVLFVLPSLLLVTEKLYSKTDFSLLFKKKTKPLEAIGNDDNVVTIEDRLTEDGESKIEPNEEVVEDSEKD